MRIKKYIASNVKEAMEQMKSDLGEEAIILSTRTLATSRSNSEPAVEITAAMDSSNNDDTPPSSIIAPPRERIRAFDVRKYTETYKREAPIRPPRPQLRPGAPLAQPQPTPPEKNDKHNNAAAFVQLRDELESIKESLAHVANDVRYRHSASLNELSQRLYKYLLNADIEERLALETIAETMAQSETDSYAEAAEIARRKLVGGLQMHTPLEKTDARQIVAMVGPTGVGKTTSIAKLAAISKLAGKADTLIVSTDTYRVGGAEQLETIAAIANIPYETVYSSQELRQLILREHKRDFIFIDTVGRSPQSAGQLQEIKAFLDAATPDVVFLVQNATASTAMFRLTSQKFALLHPTHVILTKLDEAPSVGHLVGELRAVAQPLAYYAFGQTIPDDIEPAGKAALADRIFIEAPENDLEAEVTIE